MKMERDIYPRIKAAAEKTSWLYHRLETANMDGMPDILVTKGAEYWFIEVKILRKKALNCVAKDLKWQFGQLAFMQRCLWNKTRYLLMIFNAAQYIVLKGPAEGPLNYPNIIEHI